MKIEGSAKPPLPELKVEVKKKLKTLAFSKGDSSVELTIDHNGEINIIELDVWVSDLLFKEYEKDRLRKSLLGK